MSERQYAVKWHAIEMDDTPLTAEEIEEDRREAFFEDDWDFQRTIQLGVAAHHLASFNRQTATATPIPDERIIQLNWTAIDYERAVSALWDAPKPLTIRDAAAYEEKIANARWAMRYRCAQMLLQLGISSFINHDDVPGAIYGWQPGDSVPKRPAEKVPA